MVPKNTVGFETCLNKGTWITFENGCTVSIQWGAGNYCDNRNLHIETLVNQQGTPRSATAEIAGWDKDSKWIRMPHWDDDVCGYQTPAQVLEYMNYVAARKG